MKFALSNNSSPAEQRTNIKVNEREKRKISILFDSNWPSPSSVSFSFTFGVEFEVWFFLIDEFPNEEELNQPECRVEIFIEGFEIVRKELAVLLD